MPLRPSCTFTSSYVQTFTFTFIWMGNIFFSHKEREANECAENFEDCNEFL